MAAELDLLESVTLRDPRSPADVDRHLIRASALAVNDDKGFLVEPDVIMAPRKGLGRRVYDSVFCWSGSRDEREKTVNLAPRASALTPITELRGT